LEVLEAAFFFGEQAINKKIQNIRSCFANMF
jgi:hypothetical protein